MGTIIDLSVLSTVQKKNESRCHAGRNSFIGVSEYRVTDAGVIHSLPPKQKNTFDHICSFMYVCTK